MSRLFIAGMLFLFLSILSSSLGVFLYTDYHGIVLDEDMFAFQEGPSYIIYFKAHIWLFLLSLFTLMASFVVEYFDFIKKH